MRDWSLKHLSNGALLRDLKTLAAQDCIHLAKLLAHLAEVQERKLFREAAQPSMFAYCVNVLHFSDDVAGKRIHVAGVARRVPALLTAIAEGRLHLSGASTIASHLTPENAEELLAAVTHKTREEILVILAARAPRADLPERVTPIQPTSQAESAQVVANIEPEHAPGHVLPAAAPGPETPSVAPAAPVLTMQAPPPGRVTPLAPERYGIQFTVNQATRELLKRVQDLLGDPTKRKLENVFERALQLLARDLERRKCAATDRPRKAKRPKSPDAISASVRHEVWKRDQGQCTFVNEEGRRCPSRGGLEMDHIRPKARAALEGKTTALTAADVRLLCREHNQLLAERVYGAELMRHKRESAMAARAAARASKSVRTLKGDMRGGKSSAGGAHP